MTLYAAVMAKPTATSVNFVQELRKTAKVNAHAPMMEDHRLNLLPRLRSMWELLATLRPSSLAAVPIFNAFPALFTVEPPCAFATLKLMKGALQQRFASDCVGWVLSVMNVIAAMDKNVVIIVVMILPNVTQRK